MTSPSRYLLRAAWPVEGDDPLPFVRRRADKANIMKAMILESAGVSLKPIERPDPHLAAGGIRLKVEACAVCRTDLHVVDGDLPHPKLPLMPGHEVVGVIDAVGEGIAPSRLGRRVGVPWLGYACGSCRYCAADRENLCDRPLFTGYTRDGGLRQPCPRRRAFCLRPRR